MQPATGWAVAPLNEEPFLFPACESLVPLDVILEFQFAVLTVYTAND